MHYDPMHSEHTHPHHFCPPTSHPPKARIQPIAPPLQLACRNNHLRPILFCTYISNSCFPFLAFFHSSTTSLPLAIELSWRFQRINQPTTRRFLVLICINSPFAAHGITTYATNNSPHYCELIIVTILRFSDYNHKHLVKLSLQHLHHWCSHLKSHSKAAQRHIQQDARWTPLHLLEACGTGDSYPNIRNAGKATHSSGFSRVQIV
jgi:hypothetical protein